MAQSIGANIKAARCALGLKQDDLAEKLGLTQANISRIESSVKGPSAEMLLSIASTLGCDVRQLMGVESYSQDGNPPVLDEDARSFVLNVMKSDPQLGIHLRSFAQNSMTDEDWKFLAASLKLALGYAAEAIEARRLKGNF